jgi:DNA-binding IclR family transcriptional regulator
MELESDFPAPALAKGLLLMEQLTKDGQSSLEQIARKHQWPKSSTLRYLQTLEKLGIVHQHPDTLRWQALQRLRPVRSELTGPLAELHARLPALAEESGHCAELYRVGGRHVTLVDRAEPEGGEVTITARIGFHRDLRELDATAGILFAFTDILPSSGMWWWEEGEKTPVSVETRDRSLVRIRETTLAVDHAFNEHGIRRHALPVLDGTVLIGILAIAQRLTPKFRSEGERIHTVLTTQLRTINSELRT